MPQGKRPSRKVRHRGGPRKTAKRPAPKTSRAVRSRTHQEINYRLGRLQRLVLVAVAESERAQSPTPLAKLSHMVAQVRGHTVRPDRKKVHKNTFYRAVQSLCEKGYVRRGSPVRGLRLLSKGRRIIQERDLSWDEEKTTARKVERRLLRRQSTWKKTGKAAASTRR